ncbi:MAG: small multi-drug export protein [Candidatus Moranbacteria bacterium]|nr:small multi-drug export protein [Candidatus Moranbacteria bacterium]
MKEIIIESVSNLPHEWATFLLAMIPITELRASIPIAILTFKMAPMTAFILSVLGNVLVGALTFIFVDKIFDFFLEKVEWLNKIWKKYIHRIQTKNVEKFEKWGAFALITFVAIPLPLTGIVTGAVAASIFDVPFKKAIPLLAVGSVIAGILVTIITLFFPQFVFGK